MSEPLVLSSRQNPLVKRARSLHERKARYRERAFLVEGIRLIEAALEAGSRPEILFVEQDNVEQRIDKLVNELTTGKVEVRWLTPALFRDIAETEHPQGILGIFPFPDPDVDLFDSGAAEIAVVADGIRDPGNLGTLMRSILAAGGHAIYYLPGTVDPYSPKVVRAGMGAHFKLPIRRVRHPHESPAFVPDRQIVLAEAGGDTPYDQVDWSRPTSLIIGGEAHGVSDRLRDLATITVDIPLQNGVESLNAAIAGSVILFEASRQRRSRTGG